MSKIVQEVFGVPFPKVFAYKGGDAACINPNLVVGVEIETERVNTWSDWRDVRDNGRSKFLESLGIFITSDGSLRGESAEFITKPMKLTHALHSLEQFFADTKYGPDNFSDRTSVHFHANCTDLTQDQLAAVALLYSVVEEALFEFVGSYRDTNIYCVPWYQCRNHSQVIYNCLNNPGAMREWQKYTALNYLPLSTQGTIEFRHMHGTADMKKLTTWGNIIGSLMLRAKEASYEEISAEICELNNNSQYRVFFEKVLSGQLPFDDSYNSLLEKGVIQAKYSLFTNQTMPKKQEPRYTEWEESGRDETHRVMIRTNLDNFRVERRVEPIRADTPLPPFMAAGAQRVQIIANVRNTPVIPTGNNAVRFNAAQLGANLIPNTVPDGWTEVAQQAVAPRAAADRARARIRANNREQERANAMQVPPPPQAAAIRRQFDELANQQMAAQQMAARMDAIRRQEREEMENVRVTFPNIAAAVEQLI